MYYNTMEHTSVLTAVNCSLAKHTFLYKENHYAMLLKHDSINLGPTPFRNLDVWETHPGFTEIVKCLWASYHLSRNEL